MFVLEDAQHYIVVFIIFYNVYMFHLYAEHRWRNALYGSKMQDILILGDVWAEMPCVVGDESVRA
jgi:hypothetical protein